MKLFRSIRGGAGAAGASHGSANSEATADPDFILAGRFLGGDLSPSEFLKFKRRIATDARLWQKIGPVITAFGMLLPRDEAAAAEAFGPNPLAAFADAPSIEGVRNRRRNRKSAGASGDPTSEAAAERRDDWDVRRRPWWVKWGALAAGIVGILVFLFDFTMPLLNGVPTFYLIGSNRQSLIEGAAAQARGFSRVEGTGTLVVDSTGPGQTRYVEEPLHVWATIRPNSRYSYRSSASLIGWVASSGGYHGTIDGEARIRTGIPGVFIDTRDWILHLEQAGQFAVRNVPGSGEVLLTVGSGNATIQSRDGLPPLEVHRGDYVRMPAVGRPIVTQDSTGFPSMARDTTLVREPPKWRKH